MSPPDFLVLFLHGAVSMGAGTARKAEAELAMISPSLQQARASLSWSDWNRSNARAAQQARAFIRLPPFVPLVGVRCNRCATQKNAVDPCDYARVPGPARKVCEVTGNFCKQ